MRNRTELIEKLQKVIIMRKMHSREQQAIAIMKLDELIGSQKSFLVTLSLLYSITNPSFISHLQGCQMTDTEIGYCCLYMSGLDIKDVIDLLNSHRAYNINADIRRKLGLKDKDILLLDYLRLLTI